MGLSRERDRRSEHVGSLLLAIIVFGAVISGGDLPPLTPRAPLSDGIVINIPQRTLFFLDDGVAIAQYPVGLGLASWPTFTGPFTIQAKETDPVWDVPPSIQEEMRRAGKTVLTQVAPGPNNPLGKHWLGLSVPGFGIHGTNAPATVGRFATHGCIRMRAADIADLYARVTVGTPGMAVYEPVIVNAGDDAIWLEAHRDTYGREQGDAFELVLNEAARLAPSLTVDVNVVRQILKRRDGRPHRIDVFSTQ